MEFKNITLGRVDIVIQNDAARNEDIYILSSAAFRGLGLDKPEVERIIGAHLEEPERFIVTQEKEGPTVYTKQHDAVIAMAAYLNERRGIRVSDEERRHVRDRLIELQKGTVPN